MSNTITTKDGHTLDLDTGENWQEFTAASELSFFQKRMIECRVDAGNINFEYDLIFYRVGKEPEFIEKRNHARYTEDEKGNIVIHYFRLDGHPYEYKGEAKWGKEFNRVRLKNPHGDAKYLSPKGSSNYPFFHPTILSKYKNKEQIKTLIITEGEFKTERACNIGLDVVGISGIHNFYASKEDKRLHPDLVELIKVCQVKQVLFLTDADTVTIKYRPEKELTERPFIFYSAVKNFREAIITLTQSENITLTDFYFGHIKSEFIQHNQKGLDDLLNAFKTPDAIIHALAQLSFDNTMFDIINISDGLSKLQSHFGLIDADNFYNTYKDYIANNEFLFKNLTFRFDEEAGKIVKVKHKDTDLYMRVECDWFKVVGVLNGRSGELEEEIKKWSVSEIGRDYGKWFLESIPKYDTWCNVPSMNGKYKRVHNNCFNLFNPLVWEPAEGSIDTTLFFIKHLFGGAADKDNQILGDQFTVALDYLTIMYQFPEQILPVPCLVSPENGTGKSTFLKWLKDIYGSNATIIDNERFKQSFNSHYITKYIIGLDEGFIEVDKRQEKERLKKLATDEKQYLEFKGSNVFEIDFYGKIIICANDADSLMKMEEGEIRWFVVKVPTFASRGYPEDPEFKNKLRAEIPAWLHFLKNRKVFHPKEGRAWFNPHYIITEQMKNIVENTRNYLDKMVDLFIGEMFMKYGLAELTLPLDWLLENINKQAKHKLDKLQVKKYLKEKKKMVAEPSPKHIKIPIGYIDENTINYWSGTDRYYVFKIEEWVKEKIEIRNSTESVHDLQPNSAPCVF